MAFSAITVRGSMTHEISSSTIGMNPSANLVVGKLVFVNYVTDNLATVREPSNNHVSVDDNAVGNTWRKLYEFTESDGAAADGVTISGWACKVVTQISTSNIITLTVSANVLCKIITCFEVTSDLGSVSIQTIGAGFTTLTSCVYSMPSKEYLLIYHAGAEGTDVAKTPPSGYDERFDLRTGTGASVTCEVATKIATLTKGDRKSVV